MRILIDDAFFALGNSGIARLWREVIRELMTLEEVRSGTFQVFILDRSGQLRREGVVSIPFPNFDGARIDADRILIDRVVEHFRIDVFVSTYYTWTNRAFNAGIAYDFIPEVFGFDRVDPMWLHRKIYFHKVDSLFAISENTLRDAERFFPRTAKLVRDFSLPGSDHVFRNIEITRTEHETIKSVVNTLASPFVMTVGLGDALYKNKSFIESFIWRQRTPFDWVMIGGSVMDARIIEEAKSRGTNIIQLIPASDGLLFELARRSNGLVFPSLYEGFGIPVSEFLALGKPVATTFSGALPEAGGRHVDYFDGQDYESLSAILNSWSDKTFPDAGEPHVVATWSKFTADLISHLLSAVNFKGARSNNSELFEAATLLGSTKL